MIEIHIECLNPGCKITYKIEEEVTDIKETLKVATDEIVRVMNNRELFYKQYADKDIGGLTIETSDDVKIDQEIKF